MIKIYSTDACVYCKKAKAFFTERNLPFEEINVTRDQALQDELLTKSGQRGVPVIEMPNGDMFVGFDAAKINDYLSAPE